MDSLTQITLGAAVGEAVLGRKVGNRAMLWGAIGGTIPDLDVLSNLVTDDISALAFHRAITHSFAFAFLAPAALGWLVHRIYERLPAGKLLIDFTGVALGIVSLIAAGVLFMPIPLSEAAPIALAVGGGIVFFPLIALLRELLRRKNPPSRVEASWKQWSLLFFWAIFTHPLIDACTTYGTQLFQPFWDYRVSLNTISVVDPAYTLPFLACLITAAFIAREKRARRIVNWVGIGISSAYLLFTFFNKYHVDRVFERSLQKQQIAYSRFMTSPTIFNNILWQGVAEGDSMYYYGMYSLFDREPEVREFISIPKGHYLIAPYEEERSIRILQWFSDGYFNVLQLPTGTGSRLQLNDLRFGSLGGSFSNPSDFVFKFLIREENGKLQVEESREQPKNAGEALGRLFERMEGI
jgi:inner membrane protein